MGVLARTVAVAAAVGLLLPAAGVAQTWDAQTGLGPSGPDAPAQSAALGGGGVVTVFELPGFGVFARTEAADGIHFGDQALGDASADFPTVAADAGGTAIAAWYEDADRSIRVSVGGTSTQPFGTPVVLASGGGVGNQRSPLLAVSPLGWAAVAFAGDGSDGGHVYVSVRAPGGTFGQAVEVAPASGDGDPQQPTSVAVNDRGEVVVGYQQTQVAHVAVRTAGPAGAWQAAQALGGPKLGYSWGLPEVGIDAAGGAIAVWEEGGPNIWGGTEDLTHIASLKAAFRPAGGSFGGPVDLGIYTSDVENPTLGVSGLGEVILAARAVTPQYGGSAAQQPLVVFSGSTVAGTIGAGRPLTTDTLEGDPLVAVNGRGDAVLTTTRGFCCSAELLARRRAPFGGFYQPESVAPQANGGYQVEHITDVDVDQLGNGVVTWTDSGHDPDVYVTSDGPLVTAVAAVSLANPLALAELVPLDLSTEPVEPGAVVPPAPVSTPAAQAAPAPPVVHRPTAPTGHLTVTIRRGPAVSGAPRIVVAVRCAGACRVGLTGVLTTPTGRRIGLPRTALTLDAAGAVSGQLRLSAAVRRALAPPAGSRAAGRRRFRLTVTATTGDHSGIPQTAVARLGFVRA